MTMISLIANSGIQLVPVEVEIDLNDSDHVLFFHEWDEQEPNEEGDVVSNLELVTCLPKSKLYYKQKELERLKMINPATGKIVEGKDELEVQAALNESKVEHLGAGAVNANQELFKIDASTAEEMLQDFTNRWMPMPFYEQGQGNGDVGPYNWCRMKLIPHESPEEAPEGSKLFKATLLLAFDTHAAYQSPTQYDECPVFEVGSSSKTFAIPNGTSLLLDYILSGEKWVSNGLMEMKYGTKNISTVRRNVPNREFRYTYLATYIWLLDHLRCFASLPTVTLKRDRGEESVNVDMVIDIGNSRTAAIFCEDGEPDFSNAKPLALQNWTHPVTPDGRLNRTEESFDMRVAFQKVDFGHFVGGRQFVWPSMVRLGSEAQELTFQTSRLAKGDEKYSTCSSPKRYLWDTQQRKKDEEWCQVSLGVDGRTEPPSLPGISGYFNDDGTLNKEGWGSGFHYSRRALMTFAMMEIVAQTHAQINSYEYRHAKGREQSGRKLHRIILTCPTGMSKEEQVALHDCLRDALYVLDRFFFDDIKPSDGSAMPVSVDVDIVPNLGDTDSPQWMYDEATCSQFVYLYGLLTETYKNCTTDLFKAYGKERDGKQSLVVGSLDIGAGTSDIMIARYDAPSSPDSARLAPIPLFWDSFDTAGDDMLHDLIQNVLIQGADGQLEQLMINADGLHLTENEARGRLFSFFGRNQQDHVFNDKIMRRDFTLQVLVPLMYEFLRLHVLGEQERDIRFADIFTTTRPSPKVLEHFHNRIGLRAEDIVWHFSRSVLDKHILGSSIQKVVKQVAELMCANDCDVVLLSGRPSSLQPLEESFRRSAPRLTGKIVILNNHDIGDWFPFINKDQRRINNSKSIVPVGAFIGYKSSHGGLNGFSIDMEHLAKDIQPTTDYFIVNDATVKNRTPFIMKGAKRCEMTVYSFPTRIGAQQLNIPGYPVRPFYVLSINEDGIRDRIKSSSVGDDHPDNGTLKERVDRQVAQITAHFPLTFNFNRDLKNKEVLEIEKVADSTKEELSADDFCLSIQSLNDPDFYWLDMGVYKINQGVDRK